MNLYLFVPEALNDYLNTPQTAEKDTAKNDKDIPANANAVESHVEPLPETRDTARDTAKTTDHKEDYTKKEKRPEESTSTPSDDLKDMEEQLNDGFASKSVYPSIVPVPTFKSGKKRFQVPHGMDDKTTKPDNDCKKIGDAYKETLREWDKNHVPKEIIQKRIDAFRVHVNSVCSALDVYRLFKTITDSIK